MIKNCSLESPDILYRWLHPSQFKWDEKRPTSAAFRGSYLSVDIAKLTTLEESYKKAQKYKKNAVVSFTVSSAKAKNQDVLHCPQYTLKKKPPVDFICNSNSECPVYSENCNSDFVECINPAHGCVIGKKTTSISRHLSNQSTVEIYPPEPETS